MSTKIEIELDDISKLRDSEKHYRNLSIEQQKLIDSLKESIKVDAIEEKIKDSVIDLTDKLIRVIFEKLGFSVSSSITRTKREDLYKIIESPEECMEAYLNLEVYKQMAYASLALGVIPPSVSKDDFLKKIGFELPSMDKSPRAPSVYDTIKKMYP